MDQLGLAGILAEVPASVTGLGFVAAIVGGVFVDGKQRIARDR